MFHVTRAALFALPLFALASAAGAQSVDPQQAQALRTACEADVKKLCNGVQPGGGRILSCLKEHKAEVTPPCQASLSALATGLRKQ
ncbi:cysteine rich repeat-containing protein [Xanthobacter dioxanivorans]|uniref:Cysteine rich repeat-containing protein n=1 Tax=Xanthobacter dioxanivorans TaxID=2528964 RepID=A0A974PN51_9HYPH|nr:cysteine rich repeat-containing protein [Xanthobacter dioxanivorans]QRG06274.1 cysteine rich repeat-containing protein [Xanthobacter dioxanivorans]